MAYEAIAKALLREVPAASIKDFIKGLNGPDPVANGTGCGNGCGAGCSAAIGLSVDTFGHTELSSELLEASKDPLGLIDAVREQSGALLR